VPFGQDGIPPTAGKAAKFRMLWIEWKVAYKKDIEAFNLLFNLPTLNEPKSVMVCIDSFKLQAMTALIKSFCGGVQGNPQSAERRAQSESTIYAVRKTPCAMRLPPGRQRQGQLLTLDSKVNSI
jgi:hypothetical protein